MAHDGPHIVPKSTLLRVFGTLIVLTIFTYGVSLVSLGPLGVPVAIGIAASKASLVVMFFMHLKYDNPVNALTFTIGTIFVVVFIGMTLLDTVFRGDLDNVSGQTIQQAEAEQGQAEKQQKQINEEELRIAPSDYPDQDRGANLPTEDGGSE